MNYSDPVFFVFVVILGLLMGIGIGVEIGRDDARKKKHE